MPIEVEIGETGQVVEFPDGTPNDVIEQALAEYSSREMEAEKAPEGFFGAGVIEPALTMATGAIAEPVAGVLGLAKTITSGPEAGAETIRQAREGLTYQPRTEKGKEGLQTVGEVFAPVARALQGAEEYLGDEAFEATGSPAIAAAATTIPTVVLEALSAGISKGAISAAKIPSKTRALLKNRAIKKSVVDAAPDIDQIKTASRAIYNELDESGISLTPKSTSKLINDVNSDLARAKYKPKFASREVNNAIEGIAEEAGKPLSLSDVDNLRQSMQGILAGTASPNDKRIIGTIVDTMDEFLDEAGPVKFTKGTIAPSEIMPKYKVARELWGRARRSELINESFERAGRSASGFENGLVQEFRRILNNKKQARFFKPEEKAAMQQVVTSTTPGNLAKVVGRFGFSEGHATNVLGGSAGLMLGGPGLALAGQISRKLSQKLTQRGAKFADAIVRAGDDAERIAKAYMLATPKAKRSVNELTELFLRQNAKLDDLLISENKFMKNAAETARGFQIINEAAKAQAVPGAIAATETEQ